MTSAERVFEYAQIKPEPDDGCNYEFEPTWPNSGSITADSASFSYHSSLKNALNKLNFTIRSKEKVICRLKLLYFVHNKLVITCANPAKWPNTFQQFVGNSRGIVRVCLTILWDWLFKG